MGTIGGLLMSIDDMFKNEEKKIRKLFDTKLLSELLLLNYQYSNNEYLGTTAEDVYNSLSKKIKYNKKESLITTLSNISKNTKILFTISLRIVVHDVLSLILVSYVLSYEHHE